VVKRFFPQGEVVGGTPRYFLKDHLGSIRAVAESDGSISMQYDYSPWGEQSVISGNNPADFGFTGHYTAVGPTLAPYRLYNAQLGRWISRDPIGEQGGINLYGYVGNDRIANADPFGLDAQIMIYRIARNSTTQVFVYENGKYQGSYLGNTGINRDGTPKTNPDGTLKSDYDPGTQGPPDGTYQLLPKDNYEEFDAFPPGVPSITKPGYPVGSPGRGYKPTYRMHINGRSTGCQTAPRPWPDIIQALMQRNLGTTTVTITTVGAAKALPAH
jgi:RHS repeat-associated protein